MVVEQTRCRPTDKLPGANGTISRPTYRRVLEIRLAAEVEKLRCETAVRSVVLLDYETNGDVEDLSRPLSHAALVKHFLEGNWPSLRSE
jgi:hypothetical protein